MKLKNKTSRNISILSNHPENGGMPFRVLVIAGSTLELNDLDFEKIEVQTNRLVKSGVLVYIETPETKLSKDEIIKKVETETDVTLKSTSSKAELQKKAEALGVTL